MSAKYLHLQQITHTLLIGDDWTVESLVKQKAVLKPKICWEEERQVYATEFISSSGAMMLGIKNADAF